MRPDPDGADGFAWMAPEALLAEIDSAPERYSVWFRKYCAEHWRQLVEDSCWQELARAG